MIQPQQLHQQITKNRITLQNLQNSEQDFGKLLNQNSTICYSNCDNLEVIVGSKINKILLTNCSNVKLNLNGLIAGVEIKDCNKVSIYSNNNAMLNYLDIYNSNLVKVTMSKHAYQKTYYNIDKQFIVHIDDNKDRTLMIREK